MPKSQILETGMSLEQSHMLPKDTGFSHLYFETPETHTQLKLETDFNLGGKPIFSNEEHFQNQKHVNQKK